MIFLMGRQKSGISMLSLKRMLEIKSYRTVWMIGQKIRKAMAQRDAYYKLAGLIEVDNIYIGASKWGTRGRGAAAKAKVVVAVETHRDKPGFATMQQVEQLSGEWISQVLKDRLGEEVVICSDGWRAYAAVNAAHNSPAACPRWTWKQCRQAFSVGAYADP